jgi:exonuclease SbcC
LRPTRLELEGFASYRERTIVDFSGAELFVLFGPTGAGKSSLIDALVFALYGTVPRYDDRRLVAPAISQGMSEARVRLDFMVNEKPYTAVRIVQRTKQGATTKEARLECGGLTLADNADALTLETTRLLGLTFEHFTRCVVLPQGAFAEFLHARPSERQDLLVQLLGLELYERIRGTASERAREKEARASFLTERLDGDLAGATPAAMEAVDQRVTALELLLAEIEAARPELEALSQSHAAAAKCVQDAERRATLLESVAPPAGLEALIRRVATARDALAAAESALDQAVHAREAAETQRAALPERAVLDAAARTHADLRTAEGKLATADAEREQALAAAATAAITRTRAETELEAAESALHVLQRERAAAHLAQHLVVGEPCPVCNRSVDTLPHHPTPPELTDAKERRAQAAAQRDATARAAEHAARSAAARDADAANARALRDRLTREIATLPAATEIDALRVRIEAAEDGLTRAKRAEVAARAALREATGATHSLDAERLRGWKAFDTTRDGLTAAGLTPPPATRADLKADWEAIVDWSRTGVRGERAAAAQYRAAAEEARTGFERRIELQRNRCVACEVAVIHGDPRDACADALATAREMARRLQRDLDTAETVRAELKTTDREGRIAKDLARHLDARNFERWLMTRALRRLVTGATHVLHELSGGAFSLTLDDRNEFLVIDHRNADERRLARTLSGGETFLASLALALALAEQVAELAAADAARLDALFLDEGFGTLDPETLDIVAAAIEELGSRGRMVGLVTHVRDLAERIPVRFDVRKLGSNSTVERVG